MESWTGSFLDGSVISQASALRKAGLLPILTFPLDFRMLPTMKVLLQDGLNGRVPVPPETRFLIHRWKVYR